MIHQWITLIITVWIASLNSTVYLSQRTLPYLPIISNRVLLQYTYTQAVVVGQYRTQLSYNNIIHKVHPLLQRRPPKYRIHHTSSLIGSISSHPIPSTHRLFMYIQSDPIPSHRIRILPTHSPAACPIYIHTSIMCLSINKVTAGFSTCSCVELCFTIPTLHYNRSRRRRRCPGPATLEIVLLLSFVVDLVVVVLFYIF